MSDGSAGGATGRTAGGSGAAVGDAPGTTDERTYLRWYNKVGYGSGDVAGNVVYVLLSAFVMIYLTRTPPGSTRASWVRS